MEKTTEDKNVAWPKRISEAEAEAEVEEERKRLKKLTISSKSIDEAPILTSSPKKPVTLPPYEIAIKHHNIDILKKFTRKPTTNRLLLSLPGKLSYSSVGKMGEFEGLHSKNPILYLDFPQYRMKLLGTVVYPKNRYFTLHFSRGGTNVMCEDYFDTMIVFSEVWWIGREEENPSKDRLLFSKNLKLGPELEYDNGGAGSTSEKLRLIDRDESKFVKQQSPNRENKHESSDNENDLKELMQVTPTRHSARTSKKSYKFTETSSGDDSDKTDSERSEEDDIADGLTSGDDSDKTDSEQSEEDDTADGLTSGDDSDKTDSEQSEEDDTADGLTISTIIKPYGKTEHSSAVPFNINDADPEASTNYSKQLPHVSATKSKDPSSKSHGSVVQATISTYKKVEEKEIMLEFRAGRMLMEGKRVTPDPRKGLVRIIRGEEGLVHLQWLDWTTNSVVDDQIVFRQETVFKKVNQASGRVYILKFITDNRKFFFWMQEPIAENDMKLCCLVNFHLNKPREWRILMEEIKSGVALEIITALQNSSIVA